MTTYIDLTEEEYNIIAQEISCTCQPTTINQKYINDQLLFDDIIDGLKKMVESINKRELKSFKDYDVMNYIDICVHNSGDETFKSMYEDIVNFFDEYLILDDDMNIVYAPKTTVKNTNT